MKYIKKFENNKVAKYDVGDYIISNYGKNLKMIFKIVKILNVPDEIEDIYYHVYYYNLNYDQFKTHIKQSDILRLATKNEIEELETKIQAKKYNL